MYVLHIHILHISKLKKIISVVLEIFVFKMQKIYKFGRNRLSSFGGMEG